MIQNTANYWRGRAERADSEWVGAMLWPVPEQWRGRVVSKYRKMDAERGNGARLWLSELHRNFRGLHVPVNLTDAELIDFANRRAAESMGLGEVAPGVFLTEPAALRRRLGAYVRNYGIAEPEPLRLTRKGTQAGVSDAGAIARMCCPMWWRRKLRQGQARALEGKAIELGYVHRRAEIYASNATVERRAQQRARNAAGLKETEAINRDTGEVFNLEQLAAASVANPRIRRGELMTRIAGFEAVARGVGDAGEFITLTCPSKYHAKRSGAAGAVEENPKYSGATPREAQSYLARLWQNIRSKLHRIGVMPYGFRIAEPHHDGTPHWHMLLFIAAGAVETLRQVIRGYALREDGGEAGAQEARVTFKAIDWARGSAAGYVAKYVSKNIDGGGYQVQGDTEGGPGDVFPGHRVEAWASTWGIRQFQQVGGPPVGVWRELRRLAKGQEYPPILEAARSAADCGKSGRDETGAAGNWRRYVEVMGGPVAKRADRPIGIARTRAGEVWNYQEGAAEPAGVSRYGEIRPGAVYGLVLNGGRSFATVRYRWEIRGRGPAQGAGRVPIGGLPLGFAFASPWSPVNNCPGNLPKAVPWRDLIDRSTGGDRAFWLEGEPLREWMAKSEGGGSDGGG